MVPPGLTNVAAISASSGQSLALNRDGTVVAWGAALAGRDEALAGLHDVAAVSAGWAHGLALRSNGLVVAWGEGPFNENTVPTGLSNVIAIAAGGHHNLALTSDRTLVAWGKPGSAVDVPMDLSNVVAISASTAYNSAHNLALRADGTVVAWGDNDFGQIDVPSGLAGVSAISAGWAHSLALKSDGTVVSWGTLRDAGQPPDDLSGVVAISAGKSYSLALKSDGTVVAWHGDYGTYGADHVPAGLSNVVAIAAGEWHSLAVSLKSGPVIRLEPRGDTVWESSEDGFGPLSVEAIGVAPLSYQWQKDGIDIEHATNSSLWIPDSLPERSGDYTVSVSNSFGSVTSQPATIVILPFLGIFAQPQSQSVYVGESAAFSLHVKGSAPFSYQWRKNSNNLDEATSPMLTLTNVQVGDAGFYDVIVANIAGSVTSRVARLVVNPAVNVAISKQPQSETVWPEARAAFRVLANGAPPLNYQWRKEEGDLPDQTASSLAFERAQFPDAGGYSVVINNGYNSVTSDVVTLTVTAREAVSFPPAGTVVNLTGALLPEGLTNIVAISAGRRHALALRSDGTVSGWGSLTASIEGFVVPPLGLSNIIAISAGIDTSLALRKDGTVVSFGHSFTGTVPGLFGAIAIAAGANGGAAVKYDGSVMAWGNPGLLQVNGATNAAAIAVNGSTTLLVGTDGTVKLYGLGITSFNWPVNAVAAAFGANLIALTADGFVQDLGRVANTPAGLSNVVAISGGAGTSLALKADGTVVAWGRISAPTGLSHVTALAAGALYTLVLTTNAPSPLLAGAITPDHLLLSAPIAVSGYVLEATDDLAQPYAAAGIYPNTFDLNETNAPALMVPIFDQHKFYRLRKQ
jgi:alpha-tubulin suppressor-like RCC1 family protein